MDDTTFDGLSRRLAGPASRRAALRLAGGLAAAAVAASGARLAVAKPKGSDPTKGIKITGVDTGGTQVFDGTLDIKKFVASNEQLVALATLTGTVTKQNGKTADVTRGVRLLVTHINGRSLPLVDEGAAAEATRVLACEVLTLNLGPLDLNLLGLQVNLSAIELVITAIPGGGLLGDLLCAVAGLLSSLAGLGRIARLLNRILAELENLFG